jgi:taurine dioxygenase
MAIEIVPLSEGLGAEIRGLDLRAPFDAATLDAVTAAWHAHIVLLFRDQTLNQDEQLRFAAQFGTVGERARPPERRPEGADYNAAVMLISNIRENGQPIGSLPDGEMWFHHDMSYVEAPHQGTMLYAIELPSQGGNTLFANMYMAYDRLDAATKARIKGRKVLQVYDYATTGRVDLGDGYTQFKHYFQPVAITHPLTGRKALYVDPLITVRIEDMAADESDALLDELFSFTERRELIYEHVWRPGDLMMWDNWCSCHARTDFPHEQRRLLRRCTILGRELSE